MDEIVQAINKYGFPIIAAGGMGYFIYFVWKWTTEVIDPVIGQTMGTLIKLVDRVRMLDNDLIRLNTKLAMVLEHRSMINANLNKEQRDELEAIIAKCQSRSNVFDSPGADPKKK